MRPADTRAVERQDLLVIGIHATSEAYPNTKYKLEALQKAFDVTEVSAPLRVERNGRVGIARRPLRGVPNAIGCHIAIFLRYLRMRRPTRAYVPYPALSILLIWSLLPRRLRPRWIVADAFISIYDTVVNDRGLLSPVSWRAKVLRRAERRAYATADRVVVDTAQNGTFYARMFGMPERQFVPIPLATNETDYRFAPYRPGTGSCRVLFVGTLIPLHGRATILKAAALLRHRPDIRFSIIGDGQESGKLEQALGDGLANVEWDRRWKTPGELVDAIETSDICLGVFGSGDKAQRVCPYKLYAYSAVGRAIVTANTTWSESAAASFGSAPFSLVPASDPQALAERISDLAGRPGERAVLAAQAHRFYVETLGNDNAVSLLIACLTEGWTRRPADA